MQGYILLHRKLFDNELYFSEKFTKAHAWIDLLLLANYIPRSVVIKGREISLKAGELCKSQSTLAARWKWHLRTVKRFLDVLVSAKMVSVQSAGVTSIITILNWNKYQTLSQRLSVEKDSWERIKCLTDNKINNIKEKSGESKDVYNKNKEPVNNSLNINSYLRTFRKVNK